MKINNKGITLLEVIISMAILSVVLSIGYKVINGSEKVTDSQKHTTKGQISTNLINKYVSKDIEILEAKKKVEFENKNITIDSGLNKYTQSYTYTIDTVNHNEGGNIIDKVEYYVIHKGEIKNDKFKGVYSVNRKSKKENDEVVSDLELVSNQKTMYTIDGNISIEEFLINNIRPFIIYKDIEDINLYTVGIHYESNDNEKKYEFDVSPRMSLVSNLKPEVDEDMKGNGYIGFEYGDFGTNNIKLTAGYVDGNNVHSIENNKKGDSEGNSNKLIFDIYAKITPHNSNGKLGATMVPNGVSIKKLDGIQLGDSTQFVQDENLKKITVDTINIKVTGDAILTNLSIDGELQKEDDKVKEYKTGKYSFKIDSDKYNKEVDVLGKMEIPNSSSEGSIIITFGTTIN